MPRDERTLVRPGTVERRARLAVAGLFFANGFTYANLVPWLPTIKDRLDLSNAALGSAIAVMPLGALLLGMLAGPLIARLGSGRSAVITSIAACWVLPLIALAPNWLGLAAALFCLGALDAWTDSAMNAHGLRVQRRYGRSIINAFHALWSLSAVSGGLIGAAMAGLGAPIAAHLTGVAVLLTAVGLIAGRFLLAGPDHSERADGSEHTSRADIARVLRGAAGVLLALGVLLMLAGAVEDSAASWGAVFARDELAASAFLAGLPFVACQALMTLGRLTGDRLTDRFGAVAVTRTGALVAAAGMGAAVLLPMPATAILGFGLAGFGVATLFPLGLAAAGNVPGVRSGDGVTIVAWLARAGFLCFPPLVGVIADASSLRVGLALIPAAALVAAVLVRSLRPRTAAAAGDEARA
ncbi:MFS transporter [Marinitenerispora sediminis]|uniref:MFS transporter n=1 Tax=Marinitenerispora sediminis TaxID=1931232 RepID=A0A368TBV4_9ACTN|nr:MFS transporter [Marinitenerispora sediminis]RCV53525.1 MFS transporter [Marinitenerispora sediminis]RCV57682.1 MFS transporter [Marinitenerispora sediminis]RCV60762.1 MFS transporter [Marinitenerispora sediminis]